MTRRPPEVSARARALPASPIRRLAPLARRAVAEGVDVVRLNIGEPDLPPPASFFDGLRAATTPLVPYSPSDGDPALLRAVCDDFERRLGARVLPDQVRVTVGASEALTMVLQGVCAPGDDVLVVEPFYTNYAFFAAAAGAVLRPARAATGAAPTREDLRASVGPRTRALIVNSPGNPSGDVVPRAAMQEMLDACAELGLWLVVDEVYREIVFDDAVPYTALALDDPDARVVVVDSLSKRVNLCGARVGVLATRNPELAEVALRFCQARLSAPTLEQRAAAHVIQRAGDGEIEASRDVYRRRRDALVRAFGAIPGVRCATPRGAFYALIDLPVDDADAFCRWLLTDARHEGRTVHLTPAADFYLTPGRGKTQVRVAFVVDEARIAQAAACAEAALAAYPGRRS